jgi:hypothetical protein
MNVYLVMLFLHFVSLILAFFATGLVVGASVMLRRSERIVDARFAIGLSGGAAKLHPVSTLGLFLTGAYLTQSGWTWTTPWILCGICGLLIVAVVGVGVLGSRERALDQTLRDMPEGPIPPAVRERLNDPVSNVAGPAISFFVLGIMFIMVIKPALPVALLSLAVAAILGMFVGYMTQPRRAVRSTA